MLWGLQARTGFAQVIAALAFIAIAMRAVVPAGYMVGLAEQGQLVSIELCSGHAATLDLESGRLVEPGQTPDDKQHGSDRTSDAPCVFAAVAHLSAPEAQPEAQAPLLVAAQDYQALAIVPSRGLAAPPPWATGPPLTA